MTTRFRFSLLLVPLGFAVGGCADRVFAPSPTVRAPRPKPSAADAKAKAQANAAIEKLARAAFSWSKEGATPAQAARAKPRVWVDVAAVARRHPAWRLADALERGDTSPAAVQTVAVGNLALASTVEIDRTLAFSTQTPLQFGRAVQRVHASSPGRRLRQVTVQPAQVVAAEALPEGLEIAERRQANAFIEFLRDTVARQKDARFDAAETLRVSLDDEIEVARRARLEDLVPFLPPDAVGLELSNLRLRLLTASSAESAALQKRIEILEAQWQAQLRAQETERLRELERLRLERPAQLRREGEARIKTFLAQQQERDTALRNELQAEQRLRLAADFTPSAGSLGIVLPAGRSFSTPVQPETTIFTETFRFPSSSERVRTSRSVVTSSFSLPAVRRDNAVSASIPLATGRSVRIGELRAQALREAQLWTKALARRNAWTLASRPPSARENFSNETARVIRVLNMR